jgi:hypothetical protein
LNYTIQGVPRVAQISFVGSQNIIATDRKGPADCNRLMALLSVSGYSPYERDIKGGVTMHRFAAVIAAGVLGTVVVFSNAFMPIPANAASMSSADKAAIKEATLACKADAKERKIRWPASRKFVSNCVAMHVKLSPEELQKVAVKQAIVACKAEAKGKKIRWPWSRKFVSGCLSNALKHYALDTNQLRRELDSAGLRSYTTIETGCMQNVYC